VRTHCDDDRIGIELDERVFDRLERIGVPGDRLIGHEQDPATGMVQFFGGHSGLLFVDSSKLGTVTSESPAS
jgi:hypothetical protein